MLKRIIEYSVPDIDIDNQRRGQLLNTLLIGVAIIAFIILILLIGASIAGIAIQNKLTLYIITLASLASIMYIYWVNQRGKVLLSGLLFLALLTISISFADTPSELLAGRSLFFFIIPIMMASFLLRSYASFLIAGLLVIEHLLLWSFADIEVDFNMFGMVAFFIFALITWLAANTLENALHESREINLRLDELVGERTRELAEANAYLEKANEGLKELDKLKSKFVSDVSHELRTPISNINIYLEMAEDLLKNVENLPKRIVGFLEILRNETTRLTKLITDVLNASRLEQAMSKIELERVDANKIVGEVFEANRLMAESKGIEFSYNPADSLPHLMADENQLKQVFTNLIANAINYTPDGKVEVSTLLSNDNQLIFRIEDTGMGIENEDIEHLFDRFYRGRQASLSSIPGTGLGLAITKEIIELHNGKIEVQSEIGTGTTFSTYIPLASTDKDHDDI